MGQISQVGRGIDRGGLDELDEWLENYASGYIAKVCLWSNGKNVLLASTSSHVQL